MTGNVFNYEYNHPLLEKSYIGFGTIYTSDNNQSAMQCPVIAKPWFKYANPNVHIGMADIHTAMLDTLLESF